MHLYDSFVGLIEFRVPLARDWLSTATTSFADGTFAKTFIGDVKRWLTYIYPPSTVFVRHWPLSLLQLLISCDDDDDDDNECGG